MLFDDYGVVKLGPDPFAGRFQILIPLDWADNFSEQIDSIADWVNTVLDIAETYHRPIRGHLRIVRDGD